MKCVCLFLILAALRVITSVVMDGLSDFTCDCEGRSSAAAMQLDLDNDNKTKNKISRFINVSVAIKAAIRKAWQEGPMASNAPFPACASCGIRDHTEDYAEVEIRALPNYFAFNEKDQAKFDLLKGRKLIKASARFYVTDFAL